MDHLAASSDLHVNLPALLGKQAVLPSSATQISTTPIAVPKIIDVFRTPDLVNEQEQAVEDVDDGIEPSLGERLGLSEALKEDLKPKANKEVEKKKKVGLGVPKFQASLDWAADSSPILVKSAERVGRERVQTYGVTLHCAGRENGAATPKSSKQMHRVNELVREAEVCLEDDSLGKVGCYEMINQ